jgi:predicted Rossmann fold flavoprotein
MYEILKKYNHTITPIYPALSPLIIKEDFIKNLQGISIKNVEISFKIKKKKISNIGDMIFTHFGISGPCVLITSSFLNKILKDSNIEINIDFLPNTTKEELSNILRLNKNKNVLNNLKEKSLLPSNFVTEIFKLLNIVDVKASDLTNLDEQEIIKYIKNMTLTVTDIKGLKSAMVTSGGVSVKEINSSNLKSKIIENLYFTGEVIDVDAQTGGYNLQIAFSTGYLAGRSI